MPADRYDVYHHPAWFGLTELQVQEHTDDRYVHHVFGLWAASPDGREHAPVHPGGPAPGEGIRPEAPPAGAVYFAHRELPAEHRWAPSLAGIGSRDDLTRVTPDTFEALEEVTCCLRPTAPLKRALLLCEAKVRLGLEVTYEDVHPLYEIEGRNADGIADRLLAGEGLAWPDRDGPDAGYNVLDHREHYGLELVLRMYGRVGVCDGFDQLGVWRGGDGRLWFARHGACRTCDLEEPFQWHGLDAFTELTDATWTAFRQRVLDLSGLAAVDKNGALVRVAGLMGRELEGDELLPPTEETDPVARADAYRLWAALQEQDELGQRFVDTFLTSEDEEERVVGIRLAEHVGAGGVLDASDLVDRVEVRPR